MLAQDIIGTVGGTPLVKLNNIVKDVDAEIYLKCEFFNPLASVKDRIGMSMIDAAEHNGKLHKGIVVLEPTSGNTGIALAFICASKGYRCVLTMPETMSKERRVLLRMLGAELVLTPGAKGMPGAIAKAHDMKDELGDKAFMPQQFDNPANPEIHRQTTAEEIWNDTEGGIDVFVAGVGTGGTITGVTDVIKNQKGKAITSIAVEPAESPVISGGNPGPHKIQGIGAGFIPANCETDLLDDIVQIPSETAFETSQQLALADGILGGISTGANIAAAIEVAKRPGMGGKKIVTIGASFGERYFSTLLAEKALAEVEAMTATE